jgi:hypothetical protein
MKAACFGRRMNRLLLNPSIQDTLRGGDCAPVTADSPIAKRQKLRSHIDKEEAESRARLLVQSHSQ